ncbi:UNVERIFIED_CONTAM: hypothetical protein FKN15_063333 [Acipenser sinensis]
MATRGLIPTIPPHSNIWIPWTKRAHSFSTPRMNTIDDAVTLYNATLTHIVDTVAPLTTRTVKKDRNCPWYTLELRLLKSAWCKWRSSGLTVQRDLDRPSRELKVCVAVARVKYFSKIITMGHGKPNVLFKTLDQILYQPPTDPTPVHPPLLPVMISMLITRGLDISKLSISDISLSYHFLITANINLPAPSSATDTVISIHPKNLLNHLKLLECVSASPLTGTLPSSVDDAVTLYNATLTHIVDTVAPLTTRTVKKDRNCPWYTLELRLLKSAWCKWRSSGLTVHREIWTDHLVS